MVYATINPYFTGERNEPTFKNLSKGSQLEHFKAAIWTQAIRLQNPCSSQHRLPHPEAPAAGRLGLNRRPPSPRGDIWHAARDADEHGTLAFPPRFVKSECTCASWIIRVTTQRGIYEMELLWPGPSWPTQGTASNSGAWLHEQAEKCKLELQHDSRIQPPQCLEV